MKIKLMLCFLVLVCIYSCSDNDEFSHTYNASEPIVFTAFAPDSGGIREKFIIRGDNFGTDASKIKVYFNEESAKVMGSSGDCIYALVPRQPGEDCEIKVVINDGSRSDSVIYDAKTFKYIVSASVSTVVGREDVDGDGGYVDGTFAEAMFSDTRGVAVDNNGDLIIAETNPNRLRFASGNTVSTLGTTITYITNIRFNLERTTAYVTTQSGNDFYIYQMKQETGYLPVIYVHLPKPKYTTFHYIPSCAVDDEENVYVCGRNDGAIVRFAANTRKMDTIAYIPNRGVGSAYGLYNPHDKKLYFACENGHAIFRLNKDGSEVELFAGGFNQKGSNVGHRLQARFYWPTGMGVDSRGNIYVCDSGNHVVKKIDTDDIVTVLAGVIGDDGFKDGTPQEAKFNQPITLDIDKNDYIYVGDRFNSRIRKIAVE